VAYLIDTNVAIHLRDGDTDVANRILALDDAIFLSVVSRVELEGGVHRDASNAAVRRARLDVLLAAIPTLAFDNEAADAYAAIVAHAGYSRRKLLDRMIAAQAMVHRATLVTMNPDDFADIPALDVRVWGAA
jgi:tRNA(fMet)-specific endonuclease VapC